MKQLLLNLSSGDIPRISNIESNDKENDDEKLCAFYFPSKNKIVSIRPIFLNDESRGSCCDVFSVDAEWIPEAYIAAIYKISPHQAILLLKQNESSEALLSSIDPNWKIFLKNPLDLSKDELRIFLENTRIIFAIAIHYLSLILILLRKR